MSRLELSLLGPFRALLDGQPATGFRADKVRALLAYLAVEATREHSREVLDRMGRTVSTVGKRPGAAHGGGSCDTTVNLCASLLQL